jgi:caffeoyl-CoA O-methyltransferase
MARMIGPSSHGCQEQGELTATRPAAAEYHFRMRSLIADDVRDYLETLVPPRHPELQAMEASAREQGFPIIGPVVGHLCYAVARMVGARHVFEMGSGFGYSTAYFARAVADNGGGLVHHVVWDAALSRQARMHLGALGFAGIVRYHVGEAIAVLESEQGPFDLVFNDIDKHAYPASLPVIESKLRSGGVLIVDNMLWSGRVLDAGDTSPDTAGVRELTRLLTTSPLWTTSVIPIRDGIVVAVRR